jgi:AraC-like DNA-binding protein
LNQNNDPDNSGLQVTGITYVNTVDQPDWFFSLHSHKNAAELSLMLAGELEIHINHHTYHARRGDLILKNPGVLHSEKADPSVPMEQLCLRISNFCRSNYPPNQLLPAGAFPILNTEASFPVLSELLLYLFQTADEKREGFETVINQTANALLTIVMTLVQDASMEPSITEHSELIDNIIQYLDQNYASSVTLKELSEHFYFSPFYLSRKFKLQTGYTINQYIINRRMGESERMLLFEDVSIKEIAQRNGYSNIQHFYAAFKKFTGYTPMEFKQLYKIEPPLK